MGCQSISFILKTDCKSKKFLIVCLDRLSVKSFHVEQVLLKGDRLSDKKIQDD